MGNPNIRPSDIATVLARIDPDAQAASTVDSIWVAVKDYAQFLAIIQAGDLGASATLDASVRQAQDASGTGAKAITGKAITQLTQAGSGSDKMALINVRPEELDLDNSFTHISVRVTVGTATSEVGALLLGFNPRFGPGSHVAAVAEVLN